jgi:hypothetical protein
LAFNSNGTTYLGWVGADSNINIMQTSSAALDGWEFQKRTLDQSNTGVSLAFSNGMLIVAWTGNDPNELLNVATTIDGGASWKTKVTLVDSSQSKPALVMNGNMLVLAWTGRDSLAQVNVMTCSDLNSLQFGNKVTIGTARASSTPAMDFDNDGVPWLVWNGPGPQNLLSSITSESSNTSGFTDQRARVRTFQDDSSPSGPAFCRFKGRMIMAWEGGDHALNYAVVGRGSVAVYGLFGGTNNLIQHDEL